MGKEGTPVRGCWSIAGRNYVHEYSCGNDTLRAEKVNSAYPCAFWMHFRIRKKKLKHLSQWQGTFARKGLVEPTSY